MWMMSKYTALCGLAQEVTALGGRIKYSPNLPYGNHWTEFLSASLHKVIQGGCGLAASNHICNSKSIRPKMAKEKVKPNQFYAANAKKIQANRPASLRLSGVQNKDRQELLHRRCSWGGISMHCEIAARRSVFFVVSWHHLLPCEGCYIFKNTHTHSEMNFNKMHRLTCISDLHLSFNCAGQVCRSD